MNLKSLTLRKSAVMQTRCGYTQCATYAGYSFAAHGMTKTECWQHMNSEIDYIARMIRAITEGEYHGA